MLIYESIIASEMIVFYNKGDSDMAGVRTEAFKMTGVL